MKKILLLLIFTVAFSANAFALSVSANGGAYIPQGDYKNMFKTGYNYGLTLEQEMFMFTSIQFDYHRYHSEGKSGQSYATKLDGDAFEAMIRFAPFTFVIEPYIAAGGGYYSNKITHSGGHYTQDGFGFVGEAGLNFSFLIMSAGLNAKYYAPRVNGGGHKSNADSFTVGAQFSVHIPFI